MYTLLVSGSGSTGVTACTEPTTAPAQPAGPASNVARGHARRSVASRGPSSLGSVTVVDCMFAPSRGTATVTSSAAPRARLGWPVVVAVSCGANGSRSQPVTWNGLGTGGAAAGAGAAHRRAGGGVGGEGRPGGRAVS